MSARREKTRYAGIYTRGSRYVYVWRDRNGVQRQGSAATLGEAKVKRAEKLSAAARGIREPSQVTFETYAAEWIAGYAGRTSRGIREDTLADYRRTLDRRAVPFLGKMRLAEIGPPDVKAYAAKVASEGVSPGTVRLGLAPVRAMLATAFEDGLIPSNPAANVRVRHSADERSIEQEEERAKALTREELAALIEAAADEWKLLIEFLGKTGLRVSEALALRWTDVDLGRGRVQVRRRLYRGTFAPPKSKYGRRDVRVSPALGKRLWASRSPGATLVFADANDEPFDRFAVLRAVKAAGRRAGVPWVGVHALRHTAATLYFRYGKNADGSNVNAVQVQRLLGHHSAAFTLATYVHLLPDDLPDPDFLDEVVTGKVSAKVSATPADTGRDEAVEEVAEKAV